MFQFYDSPIKSIHSVAIMANLGGFNSMIVRLKVDEDFANLVVSTLFQFYDSPIKSMPSIEPSVVGFTVSIL